MYKLEIILVNPSEDLFVPELCLTTPEEKEECNRQIFMVTKDYIVTKIVNNRYEGTVDIRTKLDNGAFQWKSIIKSFRTIEDATTFWDIRVNFKHPYRDLERQFNIDRNILSEVNVLDENDNLVSTIHSCNTNKCVRFGNCVSINQGGCFSDLREINANMPKNFHIPIKVVA
jgi:hypothetical protein